MQTITKFIPEKKGKLIVGTGLEFRTNPLEYMKKLHDEYGDIVKTKLGKNKAIFLFNPDYIKYVLATNNSNYHKSSNYKFLNEVLGQGLVSIEDETWRRHRQIIQPVFHTTMLRDYVNQFNEITEQFIHEWSKTEIIHDFKAMSALTATIVTKTILGSDVDFDPKELGESVSFLTLHIQKRIQTLIAMPHAVPTKENRDFKKHMALINTIVNSIIEKHKQSKKQGTDILSRLLLAKNPDTQEVLSDEELRDEIRTFFLAGHETTATSLTWAHYLLNNHPDIRTKVISEIHSVIGTDRDPTYEDLSKMVYLDNTLNEILRFYPPIYIFTRTPLKNDEIDGYEIPVGYNLIMSQFTTQHDPSIWENPEEFNPDRFKDENIKKIHKYAYFPFGGGPRLCIGKPFALLEMKIILSKIYQKYIFELENTDTIYPTPHFTLRPSNDILLKIKKQ